MSGSGIPMGDAFQVNEGRLMSVSAPDVSVDSSGSFVIAWREQSTEAAPTLHLRQVSAAGALLGPARVVTSPRPGVESFAGVLDSRDRLTVVWESGIAPREPRACFSAGLSAEQLDLVPSRFAFQGGRFEVGVRWTDHTGQSGEGQGVALSDDSGYVWFFNRDNVELMIKVLDGRPVNGHFWVFHAGLSEVAYTLTVTDTVTGAVKAYENPAGQLASRADTSAFPAAPAAAPPVSAAPAAAATAAKATADEPVGRGPCADPDGPGLIRPGLCLGGRFEVEASWRDPSSGTSGIGRGGRLTEDSGYLWFFGADNVELVVKVLDGRGVNGRFWVFYGALSDVEYTILVRDTATGAERTYTNPAGRLASRAETSAF
jgi:hypothetical protein